MVSEYTYTLNNIYSSTTPNPAVSTDKTGFFPKQKKGFPNLFDTMMKNFSGKYLFDNSFNNILMAFSCSQKASDDIFGILTSTLNSISKFNFNFTLPFNTISSMQGSTGKSNTSYFDYSAKKPEQLSEEFYEKVKNIAKEINCDPADLLGVMYCESGLKTTAQNPSGTKATGLIQITEQTAQYLGTTVEELKKMSAEEQLDYVKKYLLRAKNIAKINKDEKIDGATLYALIFLPARAKSDILTQSGQNYYNSNKALDTNHDGIINKQDLANKVNNGRKALGFDAVNYLS